MFRTRRPVPYEALWLTDWELTRMEELGITVPVCYLKWVAPID